MELRIDSLEETVNDEQQIRTQMADTIKREKELSASVSKMRSVRDRVKPSMKAFVAAAAASKARGAPTVSVASRTDT